MTEVRAQAKHIPIPARKVRRVVDQVRGMDVVEALDLLHFLTHASANPVEKSTPANLSVPARAKRSDKVCWSEPRTCTAKVPEV